MLSSFQNNEFAIRLFLENAARSYSQVRSGVSPVRSPSLEEHVHIQPAVRAVAAGLGVALFIVCLDRVRQPPEIPWMPRGGK